MYWQSFSRAVKLLDLLREGRFGPQILVQGIHVLLRLGTLMITEDGP
jgi:hypothetical protein